MFFTYLWRELRRRIRQAIFIALGLAVGVAMVITVTAASNGVKNAQQNVLHSLYGVGTDITVTKPPTAGQSQSIGFDFRSQIRAERRGGASLAGTKININDLANGQYGTFTTNQVATLTGQPHVTAAAGGLTLIDGIVTGTIPSVSIRSGGGNIRSNFTENSFTVDGVDLSHSSVGPLSAAKLTVGSTLTAADANADDAVLDSGYANSEKLKVGGTVNIGGTNFKIVGIVTVPQGGNPPNVYIPLAKAQSIGKTGTASLKNQVNTIYVAAASATDISAVQSSIGKALSGATITDQNNLASEVTGSLSSASTLANNLGKWLSVAVLAAAFLLASLLTMAAVTRRVREFGTLKALGWRSTRIVGQVMGESIVIGIVGGVIGVGLGYGGGTLIGRLAPKLSATIAVNNAASVSSGIGSRFVRSLSGSSHTVSVPLTASVTVSAIVLAVVLAFVGGLVSGCFGGWRAARLRPAAALSRVE